MTLAVILLVSICCSLSVRPSAGAATEHPSAMQTADQGSTPQAQSPATAAPKPASPAATPAQTPSTQKPAVKHRRKRVVASNCVPAGSARAAGAAGSTAPASATTGSDAPGSERSGAAPQDPAHPGTPAPASAPTVCPPSKVIVRQGGTAEPSIQLAGGAGGDQATHQRANQMLGATEQNLKKLAGRQLSTNQQDVVNQIHQFMAQSKAAIAAGDFERGRTLAWKAQLLSEELVNPK